MAARLQLYRIQADECRSKSNQKTRSSVVRQAAIRSPALFVAYTEPMQMSGASKAGDLYVALLRGINVGGKNRLSMKDLVAIFAEAGCDDVQTYIQSGNVVFRAAEAHASRIPARITTAISGRLGFRAPVVMRTAGELRTIARGNPFLRAGRSRELFPWAPDLLYNPETMTPLRDRYRGTLLGLAVGNTLGLPVESWPSREIRRRYPKGIREIDPLELELPWDDDLAQAVILAEAILQHDTLRNDDLAARLMDWFQSNGRGMGSQTRAVINALRQGMLPSEAARLVWERDSGQPAGNGAVMRCSPVAMRWPRDRTKLLEETENSSRVTHPDPRCSWSAFAVNLAVAEALNGRTASIDSIGDAMERAGVGPHALHAV